MVVFQLDSSSNVIITENGSVKAILDPNNTNIYPILSNTDTFEVRGNGGSFFFKQSETTVPASTDRTELISKLKQDFFKPTSSGGAVDVITGKHEINTGAWGEPKFSQNFSIGRGNFTFELSQDYKRLLNDVELLNGALDDKIYSEKGKLVVTTSVLGEKVTNRTLNHYQYQENRGQVYSDSEWIPNAGNGKLFFVVRSKPEGAVQEDRYEIDSSLLPSDISKGNVYDIQFQWRGAGDYNVFANLEKVFVKNNLGSTVELTVTNPSISVAWEAQKGGHTFGGVVRLGSAIRWGLFTKENGVFFEWEYEDDRDPKIECGCWDVTSEGGSSATIKYGSIAQTEIASDSGERQALVVRIPNTRTVRGGHVWEFTRSVQIKRIIVGQNDESRVRIYYTRDSSAIVNTGSTDWALDYLTRTAEYLINDDADAARTFTFDKAKAELIFGTRVEQDQPQQLSNPLAPNGDVRLRPGDYLIITHDTPGTDLVDISFEFGAQQ